jgi:hypothetical protein
LSSELYFCFVLLFLCCFLLFFFCGFLGTKKGALNSQPQVIKFTSYLPMVCGSLRVLWLLPPLKLVAMIKAEIYDNVHKHNQLIKGSDFCHSVENRNKIFRPRTLSRLHLRGSMDSSW